MSLTCFISCAAYPRANRILPLFTSDASNRRRFQINILPAPQILLEISLPQICLFVFMQVGSQCTPLINHRFFALLFAHPTLILQTLSSRKIVSIRDVSTSERFHPLGHSYYILSLVVVYCDASCPSPVFQPHFKVPRT